MGCEYFCTMVYIILQLCREGTTHWSTLTSFIGSIITTNQITTFQLKPGQQ